MPFHDEALLALLRMFGQSSVGKSKLPNGTIFVDDINNLATVKRPKTKMPDDYRDSFPGPNRSDGPAELNAWDSEHLPLMHRLHRSVERCGTLAQMHAI